MNFGFDPDSIVARAKSASSSPKILTCGQSITSGAFLFCLVSILGFGPWAFAGRALASQVREGGLYALCAIAFMGSAGIALQRLIIGPVPLAKFYGLFSLAFFLYALAWCIAWFALAKKIGMQPAGLVGSLAGTIAMGYVIARAFSAREQCFKIISVLFLTHTAGYFLGDQLYAWSHTESATSLLGGALGKTGLAMFGKSLWGVAYGLGMGAGLGYAFYAAQKEARVRLQSK